MVCHMLSDHCLSRLVCDVGALWPNGWMDQDETCHGDRSRPQPHCVRCRAGSVWIFQIRFGFQPQVLGFGFFGFGISTPPQCKSIPVCENTNTELINLHKKFHLKHID